jgi:hypothetical protein
VVEDPPIDVDGVLDERQLEMEPGLGHHPLGLAELQHERLLRLVHGKQGAHRHHDDHRHEDADADQDVAVHG